MSRTLRAIFLGKPVAGLLRSAMVLRLMAVPATEKKLLLRALVVVSLIRSALWFLPSTRLQRLLKRPSRTVGLVTESDARRFSSAVKAAAEQVGAPQLAQALALQVLLRHSGSEPRVLVGSRRNADGTENPHAWLEWRGIVLIGEEDLSDAVEFGASRG